MRCSGYSGISICLAQSEIHISINKQNPQILLLSAQIPSIAPTYNHQGAYWSTDGGSYLYFSAKRSDLSFEVNFNSSNACGSNYGTLYFCNSNCSSDGIEDHIRHGHHSLSAFPNPASTTLTIQVMDSVSSDSTLAHYYEVKLINRFSQTVFSSQSSTSSIQIPLEGIPNDIYYLNVFYGDALLQKQIVIAR